MSLELVVPVETASTDKMRGIPMSAEMPFDARRIRTTAPAENQMLFANYRARIGDSLSNDEEQQPFVATRSLRRGDCNDRWLACGIISALGIVLLVILVLCVVLYNRVESALASVNNAVAPFVSEMVDNVRGALNSTRASAENVEETTHAAAALTGRLVPKIEMLFNTTAKAIVAVDAMVTDPRISLSAGR